MADVHQALAGRRIGGRREQPRVRELADDRLDLARLVDPRHQLAQRGAAARVLGPLARLREAQQRPAGDLLLLGRERGVDRLGPLGDRALDAAGLAVALQREHPAPASLPQLEERVLEQRQRTRLAVEVVEDRADEALLELQAHRARRLLDRVADAVRRERPHQVLRARDQGGQVGVGRARA